MKLESFGDLFKFNKELFEDDYHHGQKVVIKAKTKSEDATSVSRLPPFDQCMCIGIHNYLQIRSCRFKQ